MEEQRARELLAQERDRITAALRGRAIVQNDEPTPTDAADQASDVTDAELDEGIADELRESLAAVERAEARHEAGTYGLSIESGDPIPDERLEVVPTAERTAEEQARFDGRS